MKTYCCPTGILLWLLNLPLALYASPNRPNIVILFADNLGYADVGAFAEPHTTSHSSRTPHIDRLTSEGIRFDNWNSAAHLCSASRAALITGKYPVRTGVYPGVFKPDGENGLPPNETTIAEYLRKAGYATSIIGKWHLGHRPDFLPTNQGFDEWLGVPYHMSGGSVDNHICMYDVDETMWLPLYQDTTILQQPVRMETLASMYAQKASDFIHRSVATSQPFFLYVPFSHVHQLCAPRDYPEQSTCQWSHHGVNATFKDAVEEMDWVAGQVLQALDDAHVANETLVLFTSDNGPWVAEQACSGKKGPFTGQWLIDNVSMNCTACPHDYVPAPTILNPRRCILPNNKNNNIDSEYNNENEDGSYYVHELTGIHCGQDSGLGSMWEANLRMPAVARWPGRISASSSSMALVSTLDVLPTILSITEVEANDTLDGVDISDVFWNGSDDDAQEQVDYHNNNNNSLTRNVYNRILFLWRDGFHSDNGPLPPPFGRMDVVGAKMGCLKCWFSTKSAHYNDDVEVWHNPPLLFNVCHDPGEAHALNATDYTDWLEYVTSKTKEHKQTVERHDPLTLQRDAQYIPCVNRVSNCRTDMTVSGELLLLLPLATG